MITFVNTTVEISIGAVFLVLDRNVFAEALKRGKAVRRAAARRAREATMAKASETKRQAKRGSQG